MLQVVCNTNSKWIICMSAFVKVLQYTKKKLYFMKCVYFKLQFRSCITSEPGFLFFLKCLLSLLYHINPC